MHANVWDVFCATRYNLSNTVYFKQNFKNLLFHRVLRLIFLVVFLFFILSLWL